MLRSFTIVEKRGMYRAVNMVENIWKKDAG